MSQSNRHRADQTGCESPQIGEMVYDYFNGALDAVRVREFEQHLITCRRCELVVHELDEVVMLLTEEQDYDPQRAGISGLGGQPAIFEKLCV